MRKFENLRNEIDESFKPSREKSLVLTKLDEANLWLSVVIEKDKSEEQSQLKENQLKTIKSWGNLKAGVFGQDWTEDDELTYREFFGESLMVMLNEVEEEE